MKTKRTVFQGAVIALLTVIVTAGVAHAARQDMPRVEIYGFIQFDAIYDFDRVNPSWNATLRPSQIPVGAANQVGQNGETIFSVKQTRFGVDGYFPTEMGEFKTKFEFDMFGVGVNAGQTTIRLRHAYGEIGQFLAGQTNSVFMDIDVFPNTIDYWGPAGMIFFRNIQARWTFINEESRKAAVALESPGAAIDAGNLGVIDPNLNVSSWNKFPDLTGHYRMDGDWGHLQAAAILRWLGFSTPSGDVSGHETGWGLNLSGAVNTVDKDKVLFQLAYGNGIANYFNDGGVDLAPKSGAGGAESLPILGLLIYYDKYWNEKWSSSIGYSETQQTNSGGQLANAFREGDYFSVNLLHYPSKDWMVGGELLWGKHVQKDQTSGTDTRVQFSSKWNF